MNKYFFNKLTFINYNHSELTNILVISLIN